MKMALVDVETTGGSPVNDRVIDIGIVLIDGNKIEHKWESLINPHCSINPFISNITGISNDDIKDAPEFADVYKEIEELLNERIFVAHNVRFDYAFLKHEFLRLNKDLHLPHLCTVRLSRKLFPRFKHHGLDALIDRFGIKVDARHRALPDAEVIGDFLKICYEQFGLEKLEKEVKVLLRSPALPSQVPLNIIQKLPNSVGVYIFYDKDGFPLYVGKSLNIKDRVMSHFYEDMYSTKELRMKQLVTHIEARVCAGELEALLIESKLVKELMPVFNRQLRRNIGIWALKGGENKQGYLELKIENMREFTYEDLKEVYGVAKSKRRMKDLVDNICKEHQLCPKFCRLHTGKGACFAYHLKECHGACIGEESPTEYNGRVAKAFNKSVVARWPYEGPIIIYEANEELEMEAYHLVNKWMVVKTVRTESELEEVKDSTLGSFTLDEYKILRQFLFKKNLQIRSWQ